MATELYFGGQTNDPEIIRENFEKVRDALRSFSMIAPSSFSVVITLSEHGLKEIRGVTVFNPAGFAGRHSNKHKFFFKTDRNKFKH